MTRRRKFRPINVPTSTPTFDQIGRKFERRGFQTIGGSDGEESDAFAKYERQGWITDYALTDIGDEVYSWTYTSGLNGWYLSLIDSRAWTAGETALCDGIRWEMNCPEVDDELFATGGSNDIAANRDIEPYIGTTIVGRGAAMFPRCVSRHMVQQKITAVEFPIHFGGNVGAGTVLRPRLRYYRILHNGVPVTGILNGCEEDDWTLRFDQFATRSGNQMFVAANWQLPTPSSYRFRRGVTIGLDAWVEIQAQSTGTYALNFFAGGVHTTNTAPAAKWSHGLFGVTTGTNAGFVPAIDTYSLTFNGGTWRPGQSPSSDEFTWRTADGHTISGSKAVTAAASDFSATSVYDFLELDWAREIPTLTITLGNANYDPVRTADSLTTFYYLPEDASDYVRTWNKTNPGPTTLYMYSQSPGGTWNHKGTTTFVPFFTVVSNGTGTFVDQTVTERPTSITVTRTTQ